MGRERHLRTSVQPSSSTTGTLIPVLLQWHNSVCLQCGCPFNAGFELLCCDTFPSSCEKGAVPPLQLYLKSWTWAWQLTGTFYPLDLHSYVPVLFLKCRVHLLHLAARQCCPTEATTAQALPAWTPMQQQACVAEPRIGSITRRGCATKLKQPSRPIRGCCQQSRCSCTLRCRESFSLLQQLQVGSTEPC